MFCHGGLLEIFHIHTTTPSLSSTSLYIPSFSVKSIPLCQCPPVHKINSPVCQSRPMLRSWAPQAQRSTLTLPSMCAYHAALHIIPTAPVQSSGVKAFFSSLKRWRLQWQDHTQLPTLPGLPPVQGETSRQVTALSSSGQLKSVSDFYTS